MKDYKKQKNSIFTYFSDEPENTMYWTSIFVILIVGTIYALGLILKSYFPILDTFFSCFVKQTIGIPCPGCGGTRSFFCFIKGQWLKSIYFNAFGFYFSFVYSVFFITQTLRRITKGKIKGLKWNDNFIQLGLFILFLQYILKLCIPDYMAGI